MYKTRRRAMCCIIFEVAGLILIFFEFYMFPGHLFRKYVYNTYLCPLLDHAVT